MRKDIADALFVIRLSLVILVGAAALFGGAILVCVNTAWFLKILAALVTVPMVFLAGLFAAVIGESFQASVATPHRPVMKQEHAAVEETTPATTRSDVESRALREEFELKQRQAHAAAERRTLQEGGKV